MPHNIPRRVSHWLCGKARRCVRINALQYGCGVFGHLLHAYVSIVVTRVYRRPGSGDSKTQTSRPILYTRPSRLNLRKDPDFALLAFVMHQLMIPTDGLFILPLEEQKGVHAHCLESYVNAADM